MKTFGCRLCRDVLSCTAALLLASPALAVPDLRQGRQAGPLTVYPDDVRRNLFYYAPGDLAIAMGEGGEPDIHLLHARYTGTAATGDRGAAMVRSILTVRVVMSGPTPLQLGEARTALVAATGGSVELRPLPIRRLESVVVYAPVTVGTASDTPVPGPSASAATPRPLPAGHFEASDETPRDGYWTERIYTMGLAAADAQLLSDAFEHDRLALSIGYAFLAEGIGSDMPIQTLSGSSVLVDALKPLIDKPPAGASSPETPSGDRSTDGNSDGPKIHVVRAGAIGVIADQARWPRIVRRIDINESAPPGYAALDVYCYDFNQGGDSSLYEKQIEIQATGMGGRPVTLTATFARSQPDLYARSVRFPVAVRLDRPFRFRVIEIAQDGTSKATAWRDRASWTELLDVTAQGEHR